jgi:RNA polymerase sigma-70 factor (ECF subfamily)
MQSLSPDELVRWCKRTLPDDTRAFEALVAQYKARVFATTYRLLGDYHEAEDAAQEVFVKVYRGIRSLEDPATLNTWIYRIATNTCFDLLDKRRRAPGILPLTPDERQEGEPPYADDKGRTPEEDALAWELRRCLEDTLRALEPEGRAVLVLRDVEGCSYQEIAEMLALGLSAVKMRIHRARLAFQRLFETICPGLRGAEPG